MRSAEFVVLLCVLIGVGTLAARILPAADDRAEESRSAEGVREQLLQSVSISWSGVPLRQALQNLARSQGVAMVLDRRVDPGQEIDLAVVDAPLEEALLRIAAKLSLGVSRVGPVVYLGPTATADRLRTLVELRKQEIDRLPPAARAKLVTPKACRWEVLSTPHDLLAEVGKDFDVKFESLAAVPHDLWPAGDLPPLGLGERVSLIAAQFDLTFQVSEDGDAVRLIAMPAQVALEKSYPAASPATAIARLNDVLKRSKVTAGERKIVVRGPAEEHELVDTVLSQKPARRATATKGKTVYQLNIVMPVGRLIRELGPKLGLEIHIDEPAIARAGVSLDRDVNVSVKDANVEQLLSAVLEPAGLTFQRAGKTIVVRPK
jgi:hypothetical protein